jgi:hypothetical protein
MLNLYDPAPSVQWCPVKTIAEQGFEVYKKKRPSVKKCDCHPAHKKQLVHGEKTKLAIVLACKDHCRTRIMIAGRELSSASLFGSSAATWSRPATNYHRDHCCTKPDF